MKLIIAALFCSLSFFAFGKVPEPPTLSVAFSFTSNQVSVFGRQNIEVKPNTNFYFSSRRRIGPSFKNEYEVIGLKGHVNSINKEKISISFELLRSYLGEITTMSRPELVFQIGKNAQIAIEDDSFTSIISIANQGENRLEKLNLGNLAFTGDDLIQLNFRNQTPAREAIKQLAAISQMNVIVGREVDTKFQIVSSEPTSRREAIAKFVDALKAVGLKVSQKDKVLHVRKG